MKKITTVIFDYGGVISKPQNNSMVLQMVEITGIGYDKFLNYYRLFRDRYDAGAISAHEYWQLILNTDAKSFENNTIDRLIELDIQSWTDLNYDMLHFINKLKSAGMTLAILSNMTLDTLTYMRRSFTWLNMFEHCIFSCKISTIKPGKKIFDICLNQVKEKPENCLFIDDNQVNVDAATASGLNAILYKNSDLLFAQIHKRYIMLN